VIVGERESSGYSLGTEGGTIRAYDLTDVSEEGSDRRIKLRRK